MANNLIKKINIQEKLHYKRAWTLTVFLEAMFFNLTWTGYSVPNVAPEVSY